MNGCQKEGARAATLTVPRSPRTSTVAASHLFHVTPLELTATCHQPIERPSARSRPRTGLGAKPTSKFRRGFADNNRRDAEAAFVFAHRGNVSRTTISRGGEARASRRTGMRERASAYVSGEVGRGGGDACVAASPTRESREEAEDGAKRARDRPQSRRGHNKT